MDKEIKETLIKVFEEMKDEIDKSSKNLQISKSKQTQADNLFASDLFDLVNSVITKTFIQKQTSFFYFTKDKNDSFNKDLLRDFINDEIKLIKVYSHIDYNDEQKYIADFIMRLQYLIR